MEGRIVTLKLVLQICMIFTLIIGPVSMLDDPYKTLGIRRSASMQEIKRAYKHLAREWHPDKNKDPGAENRFIEINEAYELLSDPERRRQFDQHGITEDAPHFRQKPDYSQFRRFDPFETLFSGDGFHFNFNFNQGSLYHRHTITHKAYESTLLPNSMKQPYLVLFYSDWCLPCMQLEPVWKRIVEEMEPLGMGIATIHTEHESNLARKIGASKLPYLIMVMEGRILHYRETQINVNKVVEFCKKKFSFKTVSTVTAEALDNFLSGWIVDNRVRVLFFGRQESIRLRYYLVAFFHHERVASGYVQLGLPETDGIRMRYGVNANSESLLVFNENTETPVASLSMSDIPTATMHDIINANRFLILPRLSSQPLFDQLCPPEASKSKKRLCVILVTQNTPEHEPYRDAMRDYVQNYAPKTERVRFAYVFQEKQTSFVNALTQSSASPEKTTLHVVIIWRRDFTNLKYEWLESDWNIDADKINATREKLRSTIQRLLHSSEALSYDAVVQELVDEHAQSIFMRLIMKLVLLAEFLRENISRDEALPAITVIFTIAFIVVGGYVMSYLVKLEEESIREKYRREGKEFPTTKQLEAQNSFGQGFTYAVFKGTEGQEPDPGFCSRKSSSDIPLRVHELKSETYNGLVRLLKPGCRTLVLLVDNESKDKLLPKYQKIVHPYRKNKTLMFSYMMLEKYLEWYRRLLIQTLPEPRELNINPKNCVGTVLSLNGYRRYFCMYHARHQENFKGTNSGGKRNSGAFMGFEDSQSESETSDVEAGNPEEPLLHPKHNAVLQENLLDGLSNWLDRLFEGTTFRYHVQFWPLMK